MSMASDKEPSPPRNGKLRIPLAFDDALRAAVQVPPEKVRQASKPATRAKRKKP